MAIRKERRTKLFWRVALSLLGAALILLAVRDLSLFFWGERAQAQVDVRRSGGAKDGASADRRYSWSISYTFTAAGRTYQGHTSRRGSDLGVQVTPEVYYLTLAPQINSLADSARPGLEHLLLAGAGVFLLVAMNKSTAFPKKDDINKVDVKDGKSCSACDQNLTSDDEYCTACGNKTTEVP